MDGKIYSSPFAPNPGIVGEVEFREMLFDNCCVYNVFGLCGVWFSANLHDYDGAVNEAKFSRLQNGWFLGWFRCMCVCVVDVIIVGSHEQRDHKQPHIQAYTNTQHKQPKTTTH